MKLEDYGKFTVIMRGYTLEQADRIIHVLREYKEHFVVEVTMNSKGALDMIRILSEKYRSQIHIGAGTVKTLEDAKSAIDAGAEFLLSPIGFTKEMMEYTGIYQVHSSCKDWINDPTTKTHEVSYSYAPAPHENDYDVVSIELVEEIVRSIQK